MKSILARMLELRSDPTLAAKGQRTLAQLEFTDVGEKFTGEQLALILATIVVHGEAVATKQGVQVHTTDTPEGGKVHSATIKDSVKMADSIGG